MNCSWGLALFWLLLSSGGSSLVKAFVPRLIQRTARLPRSRTTTIGRTRTYVISTVATTTSVHMTFKLPPPPPPKSDGLADLLTLAGSLVVGILFFASPIGGFILGIFNSLFVLALFLPLIATIAFNSWQYFNTISGTCPNCGAPVTVIKTLQQDTSTSTIRVPQPSICFNCGSILQANYDNTGIDDVTGRNTVNDLEGASGIFDNIFGRPASSWNDSTSTTTAFDPVTQRKRVERETTIIDVQVDDDDDDKPWQ